MKNILKLCVLLMVGFVLGPQEIKFLGALDGKYIGSLTVDKPCILSMSKFVYDCTQNKYFALVIDNHKLSPLETV